MTLTPDVFSLEGRTAVVTGAAQGIGAAIAVAFARFGADVAMCDRDGDRLEFTTAEVEQLGRRTYSAILDVRDAEKVDTWISFVPRTDVLVNNAGGGFASNFLDMSEKGQETLIRENFYSVTNCIRACGPKMAMNGGGSIVNITSIEAHRAAPEYSIYTAMKAAVASLTQSLALEFAEDKIRVNCIAPDVIPTPGIGDIPVKTPLPYAGHVDDVAAAAVYLASDASRFVTGVTLHVDGGNLAAGGWHRGPDGKWATGGEPVA